LRAVEIAGGFAGGDEQLHASVVGAYWHVRAAVAGGERRDANFLVFVL
jgi:hypothetical protein